MQRAQEISGLIAQIIRDLADDTINDTQAATDQTISIATQFLDNESQRLLENFHQLQLDDAAPTAEHQAHLNDVQAGVREVIRKDETVRAEVNTVLSAMQFSEMLRQHLEGVARSFIILANNLDENSNTLKERMREEMHTYDERKAFYHHVLHQELPSEDQDISQDLIDQLIG